MTIAQTTLLSNQQSLTTLNVQETTAAVELIQALGGGWDISQLPTAGAGLREAQQGRYGTAEVGK